MHKKPIFWVVLSVAVWMGLLWWQNSGQDRQIEQARRDLFVATLQAAQKTYAAGYEYDMNAAVHRYDYGRYEPTLLEFNAAMLESARLNRKVRAFVDQNRIDEFLAKPVWKTRESRAAARQQLADALQTLSHLGAQRKRTAAHLKDVAENLGLPPDLRNQIRWIITMRVGLTEQLFDRIYSDYRQMLETLRVMLMRADVSEYPEPPREGLSKLQELSEDMRFTRDRLERALQRAHF
ncbi:MAG: hypothetical protein PVJ40_08365 [Gammaproteobacteria bacterium]